MVYTMIKIKYGGCGIKYADGNGVERHALKTPEDGFFQCEIEQAKRLVALGVAEFEADAKNTGKTQEGGKLAGHLDAEQLETMNFNDLKKLAKDMGVKPADKTKAGYIAALVAVEVEADAEDVEEDPDGPPNLEPTDPE